MLPSVDRTENADQMVDELGALLKAWVDRGIPVRDQAELVLGLGLGLVYRVGYSLGAVVQFASERAEFHKAIV